MTFQQFRTKLIKLGKLINRCHYENRLAALSRLQDYKYNLLESFPEYSNN